MSAPGVPHPHETWFQHTLVLHPLKHPEVKERKKDRANPKNASARYLRERAGGFIFLRWVKATDVVRVGLFATVDAPQELVVIKRLAGLSTFCAVVSSNRRRPLAPEIEISTLRDPLVVRRLPTDQTMPYFAQLHAVQLHNWGVWKMKNKDGEKEEVDYAAWLEQRKKEDDDPEIFALDDEDPNSVRKKGQPEICDFDATLFYKYYNGGTLYNLIQEYRDAKRVVPEGFIWHVIAQIARAHSHLHTGVTPSSAFNVAHEDQIYMNGKRVFPRAPRFGETEAMLDKAARDHLVNKSVALEGWKLICHMDGHTQNIWLHYPSDEEKLRDPTLQGFTDSLPQIILGDFGLALEAHNSNERGEAPGLEIYDAFAKKSHPDMPEAETLRDKADLGSAVLQLMTTGMHEGDRRRFYSGLWTTKVQRPSGPGRNMIPSSRATDSYSNLLHSFINRLELLIKMIEFRYSDPSDFQPNFYWQLAERTKLDYPHFVTNDFVYGTMIAIADVKVHEYVNSNQQESVRWTQPMGSYFPYNARARDPSNVRRDWKRVHKALDHTACEEIHRYGPSRTETCRAEITGATLRMVRELDERLPSYETEPRKEEQRPQAQEPSSGNTGNTLAPAPAAEDEEDLPDYDDLIEQEEREREEEERRRQEALAANQSSSGPEQQTEPEKGEYDDTSPEDNNDGTHGANRATIAQPQQQQQQQQQQKTTTTTLPSRSPPLRPGPQSHQEHKESIYRAFTQRPPPPRSQTKQEGPATGSDSAATAVGARRAAVQHQHQHQHAASRDGGTVQGSRKRRASSVQVHASPKTHTEHKESILRGFKRRATTRSQGK